MPHSSMGSLNNAPLSYVLMQVVFQPVLSIEGKIAEIQSALKAGYPRMIISSPTINIQINDGSEVPIVSPNIWEFTSADRTEGVRISQNMIVFHATAYEAYSSFESAANQAISTVTSIIGDLIITRLGMRYIDYILPKQGMSLDEMVNSDIKRAPEIELGERNAVGFSLLQYNMGNGALSIKYSYGMGEPPFPQELQPLTLKESQIMKKAKGFSGDTALLDFDRYMEFDEEMNVTGVMSNYMNMHKDLAKAFKGITTEIAKAYWGDK